MNGPIELRANHIVKLLTDGASSDTEDDPAALKSISGQTLTRPYCAFSRLCDY